MKRLAYAFSFVAFLLVLRFLISVFTLYIFPSYDLSNGIKVSDTKPAFVQQQPPNLEPSFLWQKWDSNYYLTIVLNGYDKSTFNENKMGNWAFYPLYPLLVKAVSFFNYVNDYRIYFLVGILLSNIFFALSLFVLKLLLDHLKIAEVVQLSFFLLLIAFPSSYFFNLFYPESLFLLLTSSFFLLLFKRKYLLSSVVLGLALITKIQALPLIPVFYFFILSVEGFPGSVKKLLNIFLSSILVFLPLSAFFYYLKTITGDPFAALKVQKAWGNSDFYPFSVFVDYYHNYGLTIQPGLILTLVFLIILGLLLFVSLANFFRKRNNFFHINREIISLFIYAFGSFIIYSSISNGNSIFRYVSSNFSVFLLVALLAGIQIHRKYSFFAVILTMIILQTLFFLMFLLLVPVYGI